MKTKKGVALTIEEQIDALETAYNELMRISLSSGFNWHLIPECEKIFPFEEFNDLTNKLHKIKEKLEKLKNERNSKKN